MKKPPLPGRYIDPLLDFSFKLLFGSPPTKDLLIAFLNELLLGELVISDLEYGKNEHPGELKMQETPTSSTSCCWYAKAQVKFLTNLLSSL